MTRSGMACAICSSFRGRDGGGLFWPYAGVVLGVWLVAGNTLFLGIAVWGAASQLSYATLISLLFVVTLASGAITILLLAAAITRRLHDRGVRGTWGLIPLSLLLSGGVLMAQLPSDPDSDLDPTLFVVVFANNAVYLACVAALVVFLVLPSRPEPNRFGPAGPR